MAVRSNTMVRASRVSYKSGYARFAAKSMYPSLWQGLEGAWLPMMGVTGDKILDLSGRKRHGIFTDMDSATDWVRTTEGWAIELDRTGQSIMCGAVDMNGWKAVSVVSLYSCAFTGTNEHTLFSNWDSAGGTASVLVRLEPATKTPELYVKLDNSGTTSVNTTDLVMTTNKMHSLVATYGDGYIRGYLDGKVSTFTTTNNNVLVSLTSGNPPYIGQSPHNSTDGMEGMVSLTLLYSRVLTPAEVQLLYVDPLAPFRFAPSMVSYGESSSTKRRRIIITHGY